MSSCTSPPCRPELLATGALTYAVRLCRPDCVSAILDLSVGVVNQTDGYGYPALSYALCMLARCVLRTIQTPTITRYKECM